MSVNTSSQRKKLILDVDTGIDDAHAIMLAVSNPTVDVLAITCANGNVKVDDVAANTLRVLQVCDKMEVSCVCCKTTASHVWYVSVNIDHVVGSWDSLLARAQDL